jgi:hypothetical protein
MKRKRTSPPITNPLKIEKVLSFDEKNKEYEVNNDLIKLRSDRRAYTSAKSDPDYPIYEQAALLKSRLLFKAKGYFVDTKEAEFMPMLEHEVTDILNILTGLMDTLRGREDRVVTRKQSNSASNPRPKNMPNIRSLTIELMRKSRASDQTLDQFIESAANRSIKELELEESERNNKRIFKLMSDDLPEKEGEDIKFFSYSTLNRWWGEAIKKSI